ncbi:MAG: CapA family protein [Paludibacter sp.]
MKMIFLGDFVYPKQNCINLSNIKDIFNDKITVANLEGQIVNNIFKIIDKNKYNLYSDISVVDVLKNCGVKYVSLANNHTQDFNNEINETINILNLNKIDFFGTKEKPDLTIDNAIKIYGAVTNVTGGNFKKYDVVNRFNPIELLKQIKVDHEKNPDLKIIVYIHWGYELAFYPQPADREWAHKAIDCGADYIIGHHPHVVQGAEKYKNGYIFYSLGNFSLPQVEFLGRKLQYFDERVLTQLCVEIDFTVKDKDQYLFHILQYDKKDSSIILVNSVNTIENDFFKELTPYTGLNTFEYLKWFNKQNNSKRLLNTSPTFISYITLKGIDKWTKENYLFLIWTIRKFLIKIKIHKPYNW